MASNRVFHVEVVAEKAQLYSKHGKNKKGRPILMPSGTEAKKGDKFVVSATEKMSVADTGDGVIRADGGKSFYFLGETPGLFLNIEDVAKTDFVKNGKVKDVYTVKANDTLSGIAQHYYKNGDREHYMAIFKANKNILKKPEEIYPGQRLVIPKI